MRFPTMADVAERYRLHGAAEHIACGLAPEPIGDLPTDKIARLTPGQLLSLALPVLDVAGVEIEGYQRYHALASVREKARRMREGYPFPVIEIAKLPRGNQRYHIPDGGGRTLAHIALRRQMRVVITAMTMDECRQIFAGQREGSGISTSLLVMSSTDPYAQYVQGAIRTPAHPWHGMVGMRASTSDRVMNASQAERIIKAYVVGTPRMQDAIRQPTVRTNALWDSDLADELASLISCCVAENNSACKWYALEALTIAAVRIVRKADDKARVIDRWLEQMPRFDFELSDEPSAAKSGPVIAHDVIDHFWAADRTLVPS